MSMLYVYLSSMVQVVAESFPVSSSGHCELLTRLWASLSSLNPLLQLPLPWSDSVVFDRFIDLLHIVPIIIIAAYFYTRWRPFLVHPVRMSRMAVQLIMYAALADMVTGLFYVARASFSFVSIPLWIGFGLTTVFLFSLLIIPEGTARLTSARAIALGFFQGLALLVPGLSRFAATFCGARLLGFSSRHALEVSFMIQWPLIMAAAVRSVFFFVHAPHGVLMVPTLWLVVGCLAITAWYGFVLCARMALSGRLWLFGVYTACITIVSALFAY